MANEREFRDYKESHLFDLFLILNTTKEKEIKILVSGMIAKEQSGMEATEVEAVKLRALEHSELLQS
ncbi:MAG: hypothetical protein FWB74_10310 [Defluviitaleaceae bacterium]|nr:hypothetical protein [Defluviitaleaceae bacterium]